MSVRVWESMYGEGRFTVSLRLGDVWLDVEDISKAEQRARGHMQCLLSSSTCTLSCTLSSAPMQGMIKGEPQSPTTLALTTGAPVTGCAQPLLMLWQCCFCMFDLNPTYPAIEGTQALPNLDCHLYCRTNSPELKQIEPKLNKVNDVLNSDFLLTFNEKHFVQPGEKTSASVSSNQPHQAATGTQYASQTSSHMLCMTLTWRCKAAAIRPPPFNLCTF